MTTGVWIGNVIVPGLVLLTAWLMPALAGPTLPFGVRVPASHAEAPVIAEQRVRYRRSVGLAGGALVLTGAALAVAAPSGWYVPLPSLGALVVCVAAYVRARRAVLVVKQREGWYRGLRQTVVADTSLRTDPERFPWRWAVPALLLVVGTTVAGVLRYPSMPDHLPTHYRGTGAVDHFAVKSVGPAFAPVFTQAALTAFLLLVIWLTYRARADLDPARPGVTAYQYRRFLSRMTVSLLLLTACVDLTVLLAARQVWHGDRTVSPVILSAPVLAGMALVTGVAVRSGQSGSRIPVPDALADQDRTTDGRTVHHDDDRHWRAGGLLYANRQDPTLLVPKRFGIGWTLNFGNPRVLLLVALIVAFPVLMNLITR